MISDLFSLLESLGLGYRTRAIHSQFYNRKAFKYLPCYACINALVNQYADVIIVFFELIRGKAKKDNIQFMDSMPLRVCKNMRISTYRTIP